MAPGAGLEALLGTPMTYGPGELVGFAATDAEGAGAVWVGTGRGTITRIDVPSA